MQKLLTLALFVGFALTLAGCAGTQPAQPTTIAMVQSPKVGLTTPENQKVMITGKQSKFAVTLEPDSAKAAVSKVLVYGDNGITCAKSSESDYVWYCTGGKPVEVATVFVKVTGNFPDSTAEYTVQVVAPTPEPPTIAPPAFTEVPSIAATLAPTDTAKAPAAAVAGTLALPASATPSCTSYRPPIEGPPVAGEVKITSLTNCTGGLPSGAAIPLGGTYSGIPDNLDLWILVYPPNLAYYPQSSVACQELPVQRSGGRWSVTVYLGRKGFAEQFDIVAVLADSQASQAFKSYLRAGCDDNKWDAFSVLPQGRITEMDAITVQTRG